MFNPKDYVPQAPCYWRVANDGADFRCEECGEYGTASSMYYCLTPNGKTSMLHKTCVDEDWLKNAKQMPTHV